MKNWLLGAVIVAVATTLVPTVSEAKRFGGGSSSGTQRSMPARTAPDAPAPKPAAPTQAAPATAGAAAAAPAAAAGKRSWMGPIAGLAAGLGIAALMSHLGMGEAFGNFLMLALLGVAAFFVIRLLMRRFGPGAAAAQNQASGMQYANAGAGAGAGTPAQVAWPQPASGAAMPAPLADTAAAETPASAPASTSTVTQAFVPANFDAEGFGRIAKMIFIRMQTANDARDLDDLRKFTTPEMFAMARIEIQDRGTKAQQTDVVRVDAEVLDVANEGEQQIVSVRFHGQVVEEAGAAPTAFDEIWHLVKPNDDSRSWAIAGIEQRQ